MSDRRPTDREMEDALREVGAATNYPPTPDISGSVRNRLESGASRPARSRKWFESPAFRIAAALIVVGVLAIPVVPLLREDVTSGSGGGVSQSQSDGMQAGGGGEMERSPLPSSSAESDTSGSAADSDMPDSAAGGSDTRVDFGRVLDLTTEITPAEARRISGSPLPRLRVDGTPRRPNALYAAGDSVVLVYQPEPGLPEMGETGIGAVISSLPGRDASAYLEGKEDVYRRVEDGYWFPDGGELQMRIGTTSNLPGGALLYESDGRVVVLRSALSEGRAVDISR